VADIFISYSRKDSARVAPIADALEAEGFSVWWDPEILPGTTFDEVIDRALNAAKCVIVAWSHNSVGSRWVREEANDGLNREILIPLRIDGVPLPRGFKLVQTEDFAAWAGDRRAECWQRVMLQTRALVGVPQPVASLVAAAADERQVHAFAPSPAPVLAVDDGGGTVQAIAADRASGTGATFAMTALCALVLAVTWFTRSSESGGLISTTAAVAAMAFILFRFAESDLSPGAHALVARWFLPQKGKVQIKTVEAFNNMFEAVFGRKHLSRKCFWRSALASVISYLLCLIILDFSVELHISLSHALTSGGKEKIVFFLVLIWCSSNIFGDYFALFSTRILLRIAVKRPFLLVAISILDLLLTPLLWLIGFVIAAIVVEGPLESLTEANEFLPKYADDQLGFTTAHIAVWASLMTTYITSVWLWLALLLAPLARIALWSRAKGMTALGSLMSAQQRPFTALGYLTAVMILIVGFAIWGVKATLAH
jgi:hypothetical protein